MPADSLARSEALSIAWSLSRSSARLLLMADFAGKHDDVPGLVPDDGETTRDHALRIAVELVKAAERLTRWAADRPDLYAERQNPPRRRKPTQ